MAIVGNEHILAGDSGSKALDKLDVVVHTCNFSTWEAKAQDYKLPRLRPACFTKQILVQT